MRMSSIPTLSSELSPRPRIHTGEIPSNATAVKQQTILPRLIRDSSQRFRGNSRITQPRERSISDAGSVIVKPQSRGRGITFGSTQEFREVRGSVPVQRLDRKISDQKVQQLLKLRNQKLKEAERKGNGVEVFRLKNLNLFDEIETPESNENERKEVELSEDITGQNYHQGLSSQFDVIDVSFTSQSQPLNQGHTATLCWHLKLEHIQGLRVPDEFSHCAIHPSPSPSASSSPSFTSQSLSPSSFSSGSRSSLRRTKVSSSTLRDFSAPSPAVTPTPTAIVSEPSTPKEHSSIVSSPGDEDSFLYLAKYLRRGAEGDRQVDETQEPRLQASNADPKRPSHTKCTCTNHNCHTYLSGPPSKHCRFCKLPKPHPEIATAADRIEDMKTSVLAHADANLPVGVPAEAQEHWKFEALQEDMKLVEMYNAETEKRCRKGVWWEGWLIVGDLKRQGIIGSKPYSISTREAINSIA